MPYLKCPDCDQLAHVATNYEAAIHCPRCRALHQDVQLLPLDQPTRGAPPYGDDRSVATAWDRAAT